MTELRRTIRTSPRRNLRLDDALVPLLVGELCEPSAELWLVSPWVSDVPVLDNADQQFEVLLGEGSSGLVRLSTFLAHLTVLDARVRVVVRLDDHNLDFIERLSRLAKPGQLEVIRTDDVHEKTMCGADWVVSGSMNFTWRGMEQNEESVVFAIDPALAAQSRIDFAHRWLTP